MHDFTVQPPYWQTALRSLRSLMIFSLVADLSRRWPISTFVLSWVEKWAQKVAWFHRHSTFNSTSTLLRRHLFTLCSIVQTNDSYLLWRIFLWSSVPYNLGIRSRQLTLENTSPPYSTLHWALLSLNYITNKTKRHDGTFACIVSTVSRFAMVLFAEKTYDFPIRWEPDSGAANREEINLLAIVWQNKYR